MRAGLGCDSKREEGVIFVLEEALWLSTSTFGFVGTRQPLLQQRCRRKEPSRASMAILKIDAYVPCGLTAPSSNIGRSTSGWRLGLFYS